MRTVNMTEKKEMLSKTTNNGDLFRPIRFINICDYNRKKSFEPKSDLPSQTDPDSDFKVEDLIIQFTRGGLSLRPAVISEDMVDSSVSLCEQRGFDISDVQDISDTYSEDLVDYNSKSSKKTAVVANNEQKNEVNVANDVATK